MQIIPSGFLMVRELFTRSSTIPLGSVSLSADDLIQILEEKNFDKVNAENNDMEFDSIEDMKMNKALLVGNPSIHCDDIYLRFDRFDNRVSMYKFSERNLSIAKSIAAEIAQRKSLSDTIRDVQKYITAPLWAIVASYYFVKYVIEPDSDFDKQMQIYFNLSAISNVLIFIIYLNSGYLNFIRKSVHYRPKEGFVRRNLEKIIVGLIGIILGAGVKALIDRL